MIGDAIAVLSMIKIRAWMTDAHHHRAIGEPLEQHAEAFVRPWRHIERGGLLGTVDICQTARSLTGEGEGRCNARTVSLVDVILEALARRRF